MKFKLDTRMVRGSYTRDGKTVPVTRTEQVRVPALPRDWQTIALRTTVFAVLGLTLGSIIWSTVSIADLLGGGRVAVIAAVVFDLGWLIALGLTYLARYDENRRQLPERLSWVLLAVTMIAIAWHGIDRPEGPDWGMAIIGAFVSFFAKILWMAVMQHVNAQLSDEDKQWLAAEISEAQTKAAIATMRRQAARTEQQAALALLAMEKERREVAEAFGIESAEEAREEVPALAPTLEDMTKSDAVRFVRKQEPELDPKEIAQTLSEYGVDVTPTYVQQVIDRSEKKAEPEAQVIELRK